MDKPRPKFYVGEEVMVRCEYTPEFNMDKTEIAMPAKGDKSALNNFVMPHYKINRTHFKDGTIVFKNGEAMTVDEVLNELQAHAKDIELLVNNIDLDNDKALHNCTRHGGVGFVSDCVICKKVSEIKEQCEV